MTIIQYDNCQILELIFIIKLIDAFIRYDKYCQIIFAIQIKARMYNHGA
jgi:hypothetical protein